MFIIVVCPLPEIMKHSQAFVINYSSAVYLTDVRLTPASPSSWFERVLVN